MTMSLLVGEFRGRAEGPPPPPLFPRVYSKNYCNQPSFEQYCGIGVVLWVWGKVVLSPKICSAPSF